MDASCASSRPLHELVVKVQVPLPDNMELYLNVAGQLVSQRDLDEGPDQEGVQGRAAYGEGPA